MASAAILRKKNRFAESIKNMDSTTAGDVQGIRGMKAIADFGKRNRILLPKRWSRAKRKQARIIIRRTVLRMIEIDKYATTLFEIQSGHYEKFQQQTAELFLAVIEGTGK